MRGSRAHAGTSRVDMAEAQHVPRHVRELAMPLRDVVVRKVASALTALSNEKQKEQRDKASGKKKPKTTGKPILGTAKASSKCVPFYPQLIAAPY